MYSGKQTNFQASSHIVGKKNKQTTMSKLLCEPREWSILMSVEKVNKDMLLCISSGGTIYIVIYVLWNTKLEIFKGNA